MKSVILSCICLPFPKWTICSNQVHRTWTLTPGKYFHPKDGNGQNPLRTLQGRDLQKGIWLSARSLGPHPPGTWAWGGGEWWCWCSRVARPWCAGRGIWWKGAPGMGCSVKGPAPRRATAPAQAHNMVPPERCSPRQQLLLAVKNQMSSTRETATTPKRVHQNLPWPQKPSTVFAPSPSWPLQLRWSVTTESNCAEWCSGRHQAQIQWEHPCTFEQLCLPNHHTNTGLGIYYRNRLCCRGGPKLFSCNQRELWGKGSAKPCVPPEQGRMVAGVCFCSGSFLLSNSPAPLGNM